MTRPLACILVSLLAGLGGCGPGADGLGQLRPRLAFDEAEVNFGDVWAGTVGAQRVTVTNVGGAPTSLQVAVDGAMFSARAGADRLGPGEQTSVLVRFGPLAPGPAEATLRARGDDTEAERRVSGRGVALPSCDDDNECTDDTFVGEPGAPCAHTFHDRACGADNACLTAARCHEGQCLGTAAVCPATSPCREGVCDPELGCTERDVAGACADDDPCTDDVCTDDGCVHPTAADNTVCGVATPCDSIPLCQAGTCVAVPIPEGSPCTDDDVCTDDVCEAGVCVSTPALDPVAVVNQTVFPGGAQSSLTAYDDEAVMFDPGRTWNNTTAGGGWLRRLHRADGVWAVASEQQIDRAVHRVVGHVASDLLLARKLTSGTATYVYAPGADGGFVEVGILGDDTYALLGDTIYSARHAWLDPLHVSHVAGAALVPDTNLAFESPVRSLAIDAPGARLVVLSGGRLYLYDVSTPAAPVWQAEVDIAPADDVFVADGRLVTSEWDGPIHVYDLDTLSPIRVIEPPEGFSRWDVSLSGKTLLAAVTFAPDHAPPHAVFVGAVGDAASLQPLPELAPTDTSVPGAAFLVDDLFAYQPPGWHSLRLGQVVGGDLGAPLSPVDLSHRRSGQFVPLGEHALLLVGADTVSLIDTTVAAAPVFSPPFPLPLRTSSSLVTLTGGAATLLRPLGGIAPERHQLDPAHVDAVAFDPVAGPAFTAAPALALPAGLPGDALSHNIVQVGHTLATARIRSQNDDNAIVVTLHDLGSVPSPADGSSPWAPAGTWQVTSDVPLYGNEAIHLAGHEDRLVVNVGTAVFAVDISNPQAPATLASHPTATYDHPYHLWAVQGDLLLDIGPGWMRRYTVSGSDIVELPYSAGFQPAGTGAFPYQILDWTGDIVTVSCAAGAAEFVTSDPPALHQLLDLGETAYDLELVDGLRYFATDHGVSVLSPPCP